MLMDIPSPSLEKTPLFHCADKQGDRGPVVLWCHPDDETFARSMVASLVAYLLYIKRKCNDLGENFSKGENLFMARQLYRFLKPEAVQRSMACDWSSSEGGVVSRAETEAMLNLDTNERFNFKNSTKNTPSESANKAMDRAVDHGKAPPPPQYQNGETDSISTSSGWHAGAKDGANAADNQSDTSSTTTSTKKNVVTFNVADKEGETKSTTSSRRSRSTK